MRTREEIENKAAGYTRRIIRFTDFADRAFTDVESKEWSNAIELLKAAIDALNYSLGK